MRTFLVVLSVILLLGWFFSVVIFALGKLLNVLLVLALVTFVLSRRKRKRMEKYEVDKDRHR